MLKRTLLYYSRGIQLIRYLRNIRYFRFIIQLIEYLFMFYKVFMIYLFTVISTKGGEKGLDRPRESILFGAPLVRIDRIVLLTARQQSCYEQQ